MMVQGHDILSGFAASTAAAVVLAMKEIDDLLMGMPIEDERTAAVSERVRQALAKLSR
jgi:hypothetical protein